MGFGVIYCKGSSDNISSLSFSLSVSASLLSLRSVFLFVGIFLNQTLSK